MAEFEQLFWVFIIAFGIVFAWPHAAALWRALRGKIKNE